ncbi:hypothetical protein AVT30_gp41 [Mycobacterium phage UnionJack]|uniref:Uncharacterized protein n=1 Tax=Mycobacterium phage UnionJack TaxID=1673876 RepID=A0A0K1LIY7_9CAUD|nr:hypothetical protein AVT30_gp41 [Mycobacterium phage UnionJack]AKU42404.1 hypothetical protein UNIONJACK_52 [Mycobacterium phage UnionJack]
MTSIVVSLNDGTEISVNGDSFDEYDGILYVYDKDERVAIFNKDEWAFGMKQEPAVKEPNVTPNPVERRESVVVTPVSKPSDNTFRSPQKWEYLVHIPTHLTLKDGDGLTWQHNGKTWVREDGREATDHWTGPYTEVIK